MFKYPELITSGYVKNFKRVWCKQYGVQLYIDKLLRITSDTNYITEYECKIYPKKHTRYDGFGDRARWFYDAIILAGTGVQDKFANTHGTVQDPLGKCNVDMVVHSTDYWKYVAGMRLPSDEDQETYKPCGVTVEPFSPAPRSIAKSSEESEQKLLMKSD